MKLSIFLLLLLAGISLHAAAQTKTRDVLFPSFQADFSRLQTVAPDKSTKESQFRGSSTKELIFNDYKPATPRSTARMAAAAGKKSPLPSDVTSAAAAASQNASQNAAPFKIPDQGEEPQNNGSKPLKNKP